jgi:dienelactone hydrolase
MKNYLWTSIFTILFASCATKQPAVESIKSNLIEFKNDKDTYTAALYTPKEKNSKTPLVVLIHEWWGANEYVHMRAKMLQDAGIASLVVDLYGNNITVEDPKLAQDLATPFYKDPVLGVELLQEYLARLQSSSQIEVGNIYLAGYCFGGTQALNYVRLIDNKSIKAVFSFHGGLKSSIKKGLKKIKTPIYVFNGEADPMVPKADVDEFKLEMKQKKNKLTVFNYVGALHAFSNPRATEVGKKFNLPVAYDAAADADSWEQMLKVIKNQK